MKTQFEDKAEFDKQFIDKLYRGVVAACHPFCNYSLFFNHDSTQHFLSTILTHTLTPYIRCFLAGYCTLLVFSLIIHTYESLDNSVPSEKEVKLLFN